MSPYDPDRQWEKMGGLKCPIVEPSAKVMSLSPDAVLSLFGFYMIKVRAFGYTVCICTRKQTLSIPLSPIPHAFNTLLWDPAQVGG